MYININSLADIVKHVSTMYININSKADVLKHVSTMYININVASVYVNLYLKLMFPANILLHNKDNLIV